MCWKALSVLSSKMMFVHFVEANVKYMRPYKILFFGDIVGAIGRAGVIKALPELRDELKPDLVIANVENLSHGRGISAKSLLELDAAGVDAYTSGNHVWENAQGVACFEDARWKDRFIRPLNVLAGRPGRGTMVIEKDGTRILVMNLLGSLFMKLEVENPFFAMDKVLKEFPDVNVRLIDFHSEATSEKEALGHYLDGRVTAIFGTHTHVPTADQKVLPGGTAYVTDVGRNGAQDSVVGFEKNGAIKRFLDPEQRSYDIPKHGKIEINAVLLTADLDTGLALGLDRIRKIVDG